MDNKITRRRLSDFLSYEWILMIVISAIFIGVWELAYTVGAVKLSVGQEFKYYFDHNIVVEDNSLFVYHLAEKNTFSYEVQQLGSEALTEENNLLITRLEVKEGDVIFSDTVGDGEYKDQQNTIPKTVRAKSLIDTRECKIISLEKMLSDAKQYLIDNFIKDGMSIAKENIDETKVSKMFFKRNKNDNRFRKDYEIKQGLKLEKERIEKLCDNVIFFEEFITNPANESALFRYKKYSQAYELSGKNSYYDDLLNYETEQIYGINIGMLTGGLDIAKVMYLGNATEESLTKNLVLMAFDFTADQPDLQYESLAFICSTIKMFTQPIA